MENKLLNRVQKINENLKFLFDNNYLIDNRLNTITTYYQDFTKTTISFIFDTKFGKRQILSDNHSLSYGEIGFYHTINDYEKFGEKYISIDKAFFYIEYLPEFEFIKSPERLSIILPQKIGLTGKDIDLAILEVEDIIEQLIIKVEADKRSLTAIYKYFDIEEV